MVAGRERCGAGSLLICLFIERCLLSPLPSACVTRLLPVVWTGSSDSVGLALSTRVFESTADRPLGITGADGFPLTRPAGFFSFLSRSALAKSAPVPWRRNRLITVFAATNVRACFLDWPVVVHRNSFERKGHCCTAVAMENSTSAAKEANQKMTRRKNGSYSRLSGCQI